MTREAREPSVARRPLKRCRWMKVTDAEWEAYRIAGRPLSLGPGAMVQLIARNWLLKRFPLEFIAPIGDVE